MHSAVKKVLVGYGGWSLLWLAIAAFNIGDGGVPAHLNLVVTGLPFGLLSLYIAPHGSVLGVAIAGVIGTVQWCLVAKLNQRRKRWQNDRKMPSRQA